MEAKSGILESVTTEEVVLFWVMARCRASLGGCLTEVARTTFICSLTVR